MQPRGDRPITFSFRAEHLPGWSVALVMCLIPVILWAPLHPLSEFDNFTTIMTNFGRLAGLVGMVMYALNLVLSTRLRFLEHLFGGLNQVYIAHHMLGGLALILLSLHPLFMALRLAEISLQDMILTLVPSGLTPVSALFDPQSAEHYQVMQQWALTFGIVAFWGMVALLLLTLFVKVPYRIWLITHKYLGLFFAIAGLHVFFIASDTSVSMPLRAYMMSMAAIGVAAFLYRSVVGKILIRHYKYVVETVEKKADNIVNIVLSPKGLKVSHKPGQFLFIRFVDAKGISREWHPFSITSVPNDKNIAITIKGIGDYTATLQNLPAGATAEIEGAYGMFGRRRLENKNQIWIAGGIGITPFLSLARSLPKDGDYKIDLFYAVSTPSELIDWQELTEAAGVKAGHFQVHPYVSSQYKNHLTADYIESASGAVAGKDVFICGPNTMMKALRQQFLDKSVPRRNIHTEEFSLS